MKSEMTLEAAKAAPATTIVGLSFFGYSLGELTAVLAFILIVLQIFFLLKDKVWTPWKAKRNA